MDDFMRGRIIRKIEEGRKITDVAREIDIAHSVVSRLWKSFKTTEMCSRRHEGGRVRSTTPAEDRYIVLSPKRNRSKTAPPAELICQQLSRWQISFLLPQESRSPEKLLPDVWGRRTIRTQTCCVCPIDQTAPYCPFAMVS
ncbi:hypothetical protein TNCV_3515741 [Trichonephila clavipes]|nr:hypothetical protein TNCV_3515741 [Trichonephila clavipes]